MSAIAEKTRMTPEEFLEMPEQKDFELIDGELVSRYENDEECRVSILSSWVGSEIFAQIYAFCKGKAMGWVFASDAGFRCFPDSPTTVRKPDVSFVKAGRMTWDQITDGWLKIVPDLVVEVVSPNDKAEEVEAKIEMFLGTGVPLIWAVYPSVRTIRVIRGDGSTVILRESDELSGEDIIPGFACPLASIFPPITTPAEAQPNA